MNDHLAERHNQTREERFKPIQARTPPQGVKDDRVLLSCPECLSKIWNDLMERHFKSCHAPNSQLDPLHVATQRLPFVLLPPGTWDIQQVVEHYRKVSKSLPAGLSGRKVDWSRLKEIASLKPARCYIGEKSWLGYVVFEFEYSKSVVLECPIEGNATYILSCHWKAMVGYTKAELRHQYATSHTKVVHKGEWLYRIRQALRAS